MRKGISDLAHVLRIPSPIESILLTARSETIFIKREDLIHPDISGNKWRKLKGYLVQFEQEGVITLGGAFSNHLHAAAAVCRALKIPLVCLVRGEEVDLSNPTLADVQRWGGQIIRISRSQYRAIRTADGLPERLKEKYKNWVFIPEGGLGKESFVGIQELADEIVEQLGDKIQTVVLPIGTGTTAAGLRHYLPQSIRVIGIRAVKDDGIRARIQSRFPSLDKLADLEIVKGFEGKGFGRYDNNLLDFIEYAKSQYELPLDIIYNSKAFLGLYDLLERGRIDRDGGVLYLHTGGLQGNRSVAYFST